MKLEYYEDFLIRLCIWREARNQPVEVWDAIWWVIMNRVHAGMPSHNISDVILHPFAFSSFNSGNIDAKFPCLSNSLDWTKWLAIMGMPSPIEVYSEDPTDGALFYESEPIPIWRTDALVVRMPWFAKNKFTNQLGALRFYRA